MRCVICGDPEEMGAPHAPATCALSLRDRVTTLTDALREIASDGCARTIDVQEEGGARTLRCPERRPGANRSGWCLGCIARAALAGQEVGRTGSVRERLGRDKTVPGHPGDPELLR